MSFSKKIISGLFWGEIGMSLRGLICFGISILIARSLGAEAFGTYSALVSFVAILLHFTSFGVHPVFNKYIPMYENRNQKGKSSFLIRKMLGLKLFIYILIVIGLYQLIDMSVQLTGEPIIKDVFPLLIAWFLLRGFSEIFISILMSRMDMKYYAAVEITVSIVQLLGVLYLVNTGIQISLLVILMVTICSTQFIFYLYKSSESFLVKPETINLRPIARYGLIVWSTLAIQYFLKNDTDIYLILYFLKNTTFVAYYNVAYHLSTTGGYFLLASIHSLGLSILSGAYTREGMNGLKDAWELLYKISILLSAPIFIFVIFQAENIIHSLYSSAYSDSTQLLIWFAIFNFISAFLGVGVTATVLLPLNKEKWVLYLRSGAGILNLILNIIFIPLFGLQGVVIATGISVFVVAVAELVVVMRLTGFKPPFEFIYTSAPIIIIPALFTLLIGKMGLPGLIMCAMVYALAVVMLTIKFYPLKKNERKILNNLFPGIMKKLSSYEI